MMTNRDHALNPNAPKTTCFSLVRILCWLGIVTCGLGPSITLAYEIQTGDRLQILVMGYPDYSVELAVGPDGTIAYFFGSVVAAGRTPEALADVLEQQLAPYLSQPVVAVAPLIRTEEFFVLGEVTRSGRFPLPPSRDVSLLQAIASAGGLQPLSADASRIEVIRAGEGSPQMLPLDSAESRTLKIDAGDVVWVHRLARIRVVGQLQSPGEFFVSHPLSLEQALALAGGPLHDLADLHAASLYRANGARERVDLTQRASDLVMRDGDVLYIPHAYQEDKLSVLGFVHAPGQYELKRPIPILEAVAMGGGPLEVANIEKIRIIRRGGKAEVVNLQDYYRGEIETPVIVNPGDTIQVDRKRQINWSFVLTVLSVISMTITIFRR